MLKQPLLARKGEGGLHDRVEKDFQVVMCYTLDIFTVYHYALPESHMIYIDIIMIRICIFHIIKSIESMYSIYIYHI